MIHSVSELLKCCSEPDKPRALTQCVHTHTHTHTLSLTGQEGSVRDIQEFLISATRANACALCLKRNDKWGTIGWLTEPAVKKKKKVCDESKRSPFYRMWPLPHCWISQLNEGNSEVFQIVPLLNETQICRGIESGLIAFSIDLIFTLPGIMGNKE